jgi:hypothetical protein
MKVGRIGETYDRPEKEQVTGQARTCVPARSGQEDADQWWRNAPEPEATIVRGED